MLNRIDLRNRDFQFLQHILFSRNTDISAWNKREEDWIPFLERRPLQHIYIFEMQYFYISQAIAFSAVVLTYLKTSEQPADTLTCYRKIQEEWRCLNPGHELRWT